MTETGGQPPVSFPTKDDDGGENPRLFPAGPRTEHKGSRRRLRFTRPCRAWPCGFSVMWPP
ncbi:DUF1472 domain-containing protein, partial [Escherichia coli]|nr:DUF1472 domain-containing protein [Escherichia coli]EGN2390885.1 DUF1472 domain-containing protein [Escherichia coli]